MKRTSVVIPIFNRRGHVIDGSIVDAEDANWLSSIMWTKHTQGYAIKSFGRYTRLRLKMATEIINRYDLAVAGKVIDHINRNPLDNRKRNLRLVTPSENSANRDIDHNNTSKYRGVTANRSFASPWSAQITKNFIHHHLGVFGTEIEAAYAYNKAAVKFHGECAMLNNLEDTQ